MSILRQFNCELFDTAFKYIDSFQIGDIKYSFDYTDVEKCKVEAPLKTNAAIGYYIRIHSREIDVVGVISDLKESKGILEVEYKPLSKYFDTNLYMPVVEGTVEDILSDLITDNYISNSDTYQNINGLTIKKTSSTDGILGFDVGINNLMDVIVEVFTTYQIVCSWSIDVMNKRLVLTIGKVIQNTFTIESDLNTVYERNITIKESKDFVNKVTIYDSENYERNVTYYMQPDGVMSETPTQRILPVNKAEAAVVVKYKTDKTTGEVTDDWDTKSVTKASQMLKSPEYTNLIEITTGYEDTLVRPTTRFIGQEVNVIAGDASHNSILTGFEIEDGKYKLIFGVYREQFSKMIKKRWRKSNGY